MIFAYNTLNKRGIVVLMLCDEFLIGKKTSTFPHLERKKVEEGVLE